MSNQKINQAQIQNQQGWQSPTLANGWIYYGAPFHTPGYMKDTLGFVHLAGLVKNGVVGYNVFTLPTGYRPGSTIGFATYCSTGIASVYIDSGGNVTFPSGANGFVFLDGITFMAGQ